MTDYVSGGYYIVKTIPRPPDLSNILPANLLTLSSCFTAVMRDIVQLQWDAYENVKEAIAEEASEFGIEYSRIPQLVSWAKEQHNPNYLIFSEVEPPLELLSRFVRAPSASVVGIGLHKSLLASFESQLPNDVNKGYSLAELVEQRRPPAHGGVAVGFEPLGFDATSFHSWLCHYAPDEAYKQFGIRPNHVGLIDTFEDARQVNEYLLQTGAEPAIWEPWLVVQYAPNPSTPP